MNDSVIIKLFISSSCLTKSCLDIYNIISFFENHLFAIKIAIQISIKIAIKIAIKIPILIPLRFP